MPDARASAWPSSTEHAHQPSARPATACAAPRPRRAGRAGAGARCEDGRPRRTARRPGRHAIEGPARALLAAERTALNLLCHLSGVATLTQQYVAAVSGTKAKVLDTRKTTPGWRLLEKTSTWFGEQVRTAS